MLLECCKKSYTNVQTQPQATNLYPFCTTQCFFFNYLFLLLFVSSLRTVSVGTPTPYIVLGTRLECLNNKNEDRLNFKKLKVFKLY